VLLCEGTSLANQTNNDNISDKTKVKEKQRNDDRKSTVEHKVTSKAVFFSNSGDACHDDAPHTDTKTTVSRLHDATTLVELC
jgi:hypothetical protein